MIADTIQSTLHGLSAQQWFGLCAVAFIVLVALILCGLNPHSPEDPLASSTVTLRLQDHVLEIHRPGQAPAAFDLSSLERVAIQSYGDGPLEGDTFISLEGRAANGEPSCIILPSDSGGLSELEAYLSKLPHFDVKLWTTSMSITTGQIIEVWSTGTTG